MAWLLYIACILVWSPELLLGKASGPGSCEVRFRQLLRASGSSSPPQCAEDGSFLPVQCKFINMTSQTEMELLTTYSRFPEAFETFSNFRRFFPHVYSYCFCSDGQGGELQNTGVGLLLSEVYDSAFSGLGSGSSFSQSSIYRILQRRMLGVRLATTGAFRCPSPCEEQRRAATESRSVFIPSCEPGGSFRSRQCQRGGQCWCVDPTGRELPGTRQLGDALVCGSGPDDCLSQRRLALSRLFSGPVRAPTQSLSGSPGSCLPLLRPLRDLLPLEVDLTSFLSRLNEVLHGLFPSVGEALQALALSSPRRLQENLFGGKFLKNAAAFNLSGVLGALGSDQLTSQSISLLKNRDLVQSVSQVLEGPAFLSALQQTLMSLSSPPSASLDQVLNPLLRSCFDEDDDVADLFVPRCTASGDFQEVQCRGSECWCVDPDGQEVIGSRTSGRPSRCPSRCERARATAMKTLSNMAAGAELHIPACSEDGDFLPLQCIASRCFCVDAEGRTTAGPAEGAVTCPEKKMTSEGWCSEKLAEVTAFRQEVERIITLSNSSHLPLGYGFLLAEGLNLTPEELQISQSEEELQVTEKLLSRSNSALQLAAFSTVQMMLSPHRRSYQPFTPQCDADGNWRLTQCYHSTGQCWCVGDDGEYVPDSLTSRSLNLPKCLTRCQRAEANSLLNDWMKGSDITSTLPYYPQCEQDGRFSVLQTGGAAGWCVNPLTGEPVQTATRSSTGQLTCPSWCELQGLQCHPDGSFTPLQCDVTSCWCVSEDGQEVRGTQTLRQTGLTPSCDRPLCPEPTITHGALVCQPANDGHQSCDLVCYHGYQNSLPVSRFLCETVSGGWGGDNKPLSGACQMSQPLQLVSSSQLWSLSLSSPCSQISLIALQNQLFILMTSMGLCYAQLPSSGRSMSLCDNSSVSLRCDSDVSLRLNLRWTATLSDLLTSDLPDLHDAALFLNESRLLEGVQELLGNLRSSLTFEPKLVSVTASRFGCHRGYHLDSDGEGCVICPAGSFYQEEACLPCPQGTYQEEQGRDFCNRCPRGFSPAGASFVYQCETDCQRRGLRCSQQGDFLPAQLDILLGRWKCFSSEGAELEWTTSEKPLTDNECAVLSRFQAVPGSDLILSAEDAEVIQTITSDLKACVQACAAEPSCHHVALFNTQTQCELYSTHTLNTQCSASQKPSGFLGNPQAEPFDQLTCLLRVRGGASDLIVLRKKGAEFSSQQQQKSFVRIKMKKAVSGVFRSQVFSSKETSLSDAHRFCQDGCSRDACCSGFVLNQINLDEGYLFCGWLKAPSVLMCEEQDWDVIGLGSANRVCGAGLSFDEQQRSLQLDFGGQKFTIADSGLADAENRTDNQLSITSFQAVYLNTDASASDSGSSCAAADSIPPLNASVRMKFEVLSNNDVLVDPQRKIPVLSFWLNKKNYNSQQALLWCLTRCDEEQQCSISDLRDSEPAGFYSCSLYPNTRVCGAYSKLSQQSCLLLLQREPNSTYSKRVDLTGPVKSLYQRLSFQKLVSYSVRSWISLGENTQLSEGLRGCERRCDEDPCCRGFGFVRNNRTEEVVCLPLISLGIQTCSQGDMTTWRTQDCRASKVKATPEPFGWYQKPVNLWSPPSGLCPQFNLPKNNVSMDQWRSVSDSSVLIDSSLTTYDVIHLSHDLTTDQNQTRDWCLHACQEAETCAAVSLRQTESAVRCILYPDTTTCGLSSASSPTVSCRLIIRESASQVYLRTERLPSATSIAIPGHGTLQGVAMETAIGSDTRTVIQFLGVPYARPPIGSLRFEMAQPADWTGDWDATRPRLSCVQPGDVDSAASSEDCLYLNIFSPAAVRERVPVLVFFFNPSANQSPGLLDASALAATGNIVVVTAGYRTAALGFLSTGGLRGNYGQSDQEAVLHWVNAHIYLVGGDNSRVTVGAERHGADVASLHLLSSSPLFQRMILMGGSVFSPSLLQTNSSPKRQAVDLARELGCVTSDLTDDGQMVSCLRSVPVDKLNAAQTKLLAVSGPFQSWSPVRKSQSQSFHRVDLLLGTSVYDGLITRARRIKDFEALQGRANSKTAFYEALSRSLGGASGNELLKDAATWFYSLDHSPTAAGYNLFSRALNNATRDLFIICPTVKMATHWANSNANVFLYHQPASSAYNRDQRKPGTMLGNERADYLVPLDVQFLFGFPLHPMSSQRFSSSDRRLSLAVMTYVSSFVRTGNPNPSRVWAETVLPRWQPVLSSEATPTYLELSPTLQHQQGLSQSACSFWDQLGSRLASKTGALGAEPVQLPLKSPTEKDAYN